MTRALFRVQSLPILAALLIGCGGSTSANENTNGAAGHGGSGTGGATGGTTTGGAQATAGNVGVGGRSASNGGAPNPLIHPRLPEMPPTQMNNPTHTRLIQLWIGADSVYTLFEDGSVYQLYYMANSNLEVREFPISVQGFNRPSQIDMDSLLYPDGTVRWWQWAANGQSITQGIPGVDHAVYVSNRCALIRDGSVRCWGTPPSMYYQNDPPKVAGTAVNVPSSVELDSSLSSVCTLVRDAAGKVTRFRPAVQNGKPVATMVGALDLPAPAVRLFDGCVMFKTSAPRCLWAPGGMWDAIQTTCDAVQHYDITASTGEHLQLASLGGNLAGVALGDSGTVYATLDAPDPAKSSIVMKPLPSVGKSVFVRAGVTVSCAVEPPNLKCWPHEGKNAYKPEVAWQ